MTRGDEWAGTAILWGIGGIFVGLCWMGFPGVAMGFLACVVFYYVLMQL